MSFWNDAVVDRSYKILQKLKERYDFVLIGGWAVWLYTRSAKSRDIDIIVDFEGLEKLRGEMPLRKNERLRKYEVTVEGISIDVYVPYYSLLIVPPEEIMRRTRVIEGFKVPEPEVLLALKQQAELERSPSIKGLKDRIDILALLSFVDLEKYISIVGREYLKRLRSIVVSADEEFRYLGYRNPREVKKLRRELLERIERVMK